MSQLFLLEFNIKDQAGVDTFMEYMNQSPQRMAADGLEELSGYVDQDDSLHVIFLIRWASREHLNAAMQKEFANPEITEMLAAIGGDQALRQTWLDKCD